MTVIARARRRSALSALAIGTLAAPVIWQADGLLAHASPAHGRSMAGMSMPMGRSAAAPPVVELGRRVVYVHIQRFAFHPARVVVSPGTRVVWDNLDSDPHTVHGQTGHFSSEAMDTHGHYSFVFRRTGSFSYICTIHPFMHGAVTVRG
jgi:plastocyanin